MMGMQGDYVQCIVSEEKVLAGEDGRRECVFVRPALVA